MSNIVKDFEERFGCKFRPANDAELNELNEENFPSLVVEHFSKFALDESTDDEVIVPDVERFIAENLHATPGCYCSPHGLFVVASTADGDAFCMDTNILDGDGVPRIVSVSHEVLHEEANREEIVSECRFVASNFQDLLSLALDGNFPETS